MFTNIKKKGWKSSFQLNTHFQIHAGVNVRSDNAQWMSEYTQIPTDHPPSQMSIVPVPTGAKMDAMPLKATLAA